jgi:N-acetylglucosamine-6-sulfatase
MIYSTLPSPSRRLKQRAGHSRLPMSRRLDHRIAVLMGSLLLLAGLSAAQSVTAGAELAQRAKPNVVVIMTDDQTVAELGAMPRTRRLIAAKGVRFDRSYVSYPVCCPSRATYLTGQYAHNHGVMGLYPPTGGYGRFDKHDALPVWLRSAGYYTAHLGKFLNGYGDQEPADVPPGWSDWRATVDYSTYSMWGYTLNENGRLRTYGRPFREVPRLYQTDVLARKAQSIVESRAGRGPFFVSLNLLGPHHEGRAIQRRTGLIVRPAPRHRRAAVALPARSASFNERDVSDKPLFIRRRVRPFGRGDLRRIQRVAVQRRRALLSVDDAVARVIGTLRRTGELDDTYVIFTSDNGYLQGEHGIGSGKMLPYDASSAVPLLIRGPGLPGGAVSQELVANVDLAPTLLELAGAGVRMSQAIAGMVVPALGVREPILGQRGRVAVRRSCVRGFPARAHRRTSRAPGARSTKEPREPLPGPRSLQLFVSRRAQPPGAPREGERGRSARQRSRPQVYGPTSRGQAAPGRPSGQQHPAELGSDDAPGVSVGSPVRVGRGEW